MKTSDLYLIATAAMLGIFAAWWLNRDALAAMTAAGSDAPPPPVPNSITEMVAAPFASILGLWHPPAQYASAIAYAEQQYGIAKDVLARLLYQESRYRQDIIDGSTTSPAGAMGIAQFMPATAADLGIDPLDPAQAIDAAGRYLATLYRRFGNWSEALAAYNWGQGNVSRKGIAAAPAETQKYYAQILGDVNAANGTNLA